MPADASVSMKGLSDGGYVLPTPVLQANAAASSSTDGSTKTELGTANVAVKMGSYLGADAGVHAYTMDSDKAKIKIGLAADTGAGIQNESAQAQVLGTGVSIGRETGISIFGNEFKVKLW